MSLYSSSVKRPVTTVLVFVAVVILGLFSLRQLPIDLYPDIDTNTLMVMTTYSGASAQDIEQNLTRPLENTLNSVQHLKHISSKSKENISVITLEFEFGYDIDVMTNDVRDKLDMVLIMTVEPGFGGQKFMADMMPKVSAIRALIDARNPGCELEVDGGVDPITCKTCIDAGANVLVAGSAVYKAADIPAKIKELRG